MDENKQHNEHGFSNGLILGTILGAGIVFLLGTKKGKQILKTLTENGLESISGLRDIMDDEILEDEEENYTASGESSELYKPHPVKRFFRRIKK